MKIKENQIEKLLILLTGLFIYYVLFASLRVSEDALKALALNEDISEFFRTFVKVWKLLIFTVSQLIIRKFIKEKWRNFALLGISISILGSILLYYIRINTLSLFSISYWDLLLILAIESVGESLVASSILTYIRINNNNTFYAQKTIIFRTGQNLGMLLSLISLIFIQENIILLILVLIRFLILFSLFFFLFKKKVHIGDEDMESNTYSTISVNNLEDRKQKKSKGRIVSNTILGACSHALFYILVFTPMILLGESFQMNRDNLYKTIPFIVSKIKNLNINIDLLPIILNSIFAIIALAFLTNIIPKTISKNKLNSSYESLYFYNKIAVVGIVVSIILWSASLVFNYITGLVFFGGIFGFFSLPNYVLAEARVGIMDAKSKPQNIISYVGFSRLGQLMGIGIPLLLTESSNIDFRILIALIAVAGATATIYTFKKCQ